MTGLPTKIAVDTTSAYVINTSNYNDFVILNGGIRYDDYNIKASGFGTQNNRPNVFNSQEQQYGMPNFNLGVTLKPLPIGSVYAAYATSSNPVGAEFDGTSAQYGGLAPALNGNPNQIFGPEKNKAIEIGTKWELFDRRLLLTGGAVPDREGKRARIAEREQRAAANDIPGCSYNLPPGSGNVSCITAGAAYRIRGIDLGVGGKITDKWSVFGGLVLMQSEVTKSLVPSPQPLLFPTNVGLKLANVAHQSFSLLSKYKLDGRLGDRRAGGVPLRDVRRNVPRREPGHVDPELLALRYLRREAKVDKNWTAKLFVANITNKLYYDALYQSATPFVFVAPGRSVSMVILLARF